MGQSTTEVLERVNTWPRADREAIASREGLAQLERGEWTSEEEMRAFWIRCGVL